MDQFCSLKSDDYRRCSCSNRVYDLTESRNTLTTAGEKLTVFTENLDVVGMTAAQASAMKTASEGENALTRDTSSSKALLQAIMNSIRGEDSNVGGKYSDLNSINISFDTSLAFGTGDSGQAIAAYNGTDLYSAVYPQCRNAVRADCNDASLQRAITAYLMAIEQDCNTVATAITEKQKQLKSAVREGSAMLDLARVENRQKHNSDDIATCVANIEAAILSEEVCGAGYHKCLDNGEYIDVSTGKPITGVADFYKLGQLLTFQDGVDAADQQLAQVYANQSFVKNFESRTKKFAAPALDKCVEQADFAWSQYLNKAMLDIYYAQNAKVDEIKSNCFDLVSACYMNGEASITAAMTNLSTDGAVLLQPSKIQLTGKLCSDYVESCNNMFAETSGDIIKDYIANRNDTDTLTACRAVVKQCFDKYGGQNYVNFYYPYSGLFTSGRAIDWFTLYEETTDGSCTIEFEKSANGNAVSGKYKSECAKVLTTIDACNTTEMIEKAFGGTDLVFATAKKTENAEYAKNKAEGKEYSQYDPTQLSYTEGGNNTIYGLRTDNKIDNKKEVKARGLRSTGVATEVYNQIIDTLTTSCSGLNGRFMQAQEPKLEYLYDHNNRCISLFVANEKTLGSYYGFGSLKYGIPYYEDMCPRDYSVTVDTASWGVCSCWENGGRRSKNGQGATCTPSIPVWYSANDAVCPTSGNAINLIQRNAYNPDETTAETTCAKYRATASCTGTADGCDFVDTINPANSCATAYKATHGGDFNLDTCKKCVNQIAAASGGFSEKNWCTNPFASTSAASYRSCWTSTCNNTEDEANLPAGPLQ